MKEAARLARPDDRAKEAGTPASGGPTAVQGGRVLIDTTVPVLVLTRAIEGGATEPRP